MGLSIYELDEEMQIAEAKINEWAETHDGDITECPFNDILDGLQGEKNEKFLNVALWIKNLKAEAKAIEDEKKSLYNREKSLKNKADRLTGFILYNMKKGEKLKNAKAEITWRKSKSVWIKPDINPELLPKEFTKTEITISKTALREHMEDGKLILNGVLIAGLEENFNIQIK